MSMPRHIRAEVRFALNRRIASAESERDRALDMRRDATTPKRIQSAEHCIAYWRDQIDRAQSALTWLDALETN